MTTLRDWYLWLFYPNQWLAEKAMQIITEHYDGAMEILESVGSTLLSENQ